MIGGLNRGNRRPQESFAVHWAGEDPKYIYTRIFPSYGKAQAFASEKQGVVLKHTSTKKDISQWLLSPDGASQELKKTIHLHRKLQRRMGALPPSTKADVSPSTTAEYQKSQKVRLLDVFVLGPIMIYAGTRTSLPVWLRVSLMAMGVGTIYYNAKNYRINKKAQAK